MLFRSYGTSLRSVFVSVDPERDTVAWLQGYVKYLPAGFTALTGTAADVKAVADLWGVRYARVETGTPGEYSMSHTAEVYLVDGDYTKAINQLAQVSDLANASAMVGKTVTAMAAQTADPETGLPRPDKQVTGRVSSVMFGKDGAMLNLEGNISVSAAKVSVVR